jgi:hypothetical protein
MSIPNTKVSTDWDIINKTSQQGRNNVFALYLDVHTGWLAVYPKANRGLAGETLTDYCQNYGIPSTANPPSMTTRRNIFTVISLTSVKKKASNKSTALHTTQIKTQPNTTWIL